MANVEPSPLAIRIAQSVGLTSSTFLTGFITSFSYVTTPVLLKSPSHLLALQWRQAYTIGASTAPPIALAGTAAFAYLAADAAQNALEDNYVPFYLYTAAAVLIPAIIPFTLIGMKEVNGKLHAKAIAAERASATGESFKEDDDETVVELAARWKILNYVRAALPALGALCGVWAVVSKP